MLTSAVRQLTARGHLPVSDILLIALMSGSLLACSRPATEEDRKALVGLWMPEDGSRHSIEFKENGVFDFVYDVGPPRTVLRIKWSLDTKNKVDIRQDDGSHYKTCRYSIAANKLVDRRQQRRRMPEKCHDAHNADAENVHKEPLSLIRGYTFIPSSRAKPPSGRRSRGTYSSRAATTERSLRCASLRSAPVGMTAYLVKRVTPSMGPTYSLALFPSVIPLLT